MNVLVVGLLAAGALCVVGFLTPPPAPHPIPRPPAQPRGGTPQWPAPLSPAERAFGPGEKIVHEVALNGVQCGQFQMSLKEAANASGGPPVLVVEFDGYTGKNIGWLWNYQTKGASYLDATTLLPEFTERLVTKKGKSTRTRMMFHRSESTAEVIIEKLYKKKTTTLQVPFKLGLDVPSFIVHLRAVSLLEGKTATLELLEGDKVYSLTLTPGETGVVDVKAGRFEAQSVTIQPRLVAHVGHDASEDEEDEGEYKSIQCWIAKERRLPVKFEIETAIGSIRSELASVEPSVQAADDKTKP